LTGLDNIVVFITTTAKKIFLGANFFLRNLLYKTTQ